MVELLSRVDLSLLKREALRIPLAQSVGVSEISDNKLQLAEFLVAFYGYDLLNRDSVRHILLTIFPLEALNDMAAALALPKSEYVYDAALIVATASWSLDSLLPHLLQQNLDKYFSVKLSDEFLPAKTLEKSPTVEEVLADAAPPLLDYQREVSERVFEVLSQNGARCMVQMPTGSGKTRTAMDAITRYLTTTKDTRCLVVWLAHSEELCEQAVIAFKRCWVRSGVGSARIYRLWGEHSPSVPFTRGLVVSGLQKLVSLRKGRGALYQNLARSCRAVVFDEAHKALARTYRELLDDLRSLAPNLTLIGLTATPGRSSWNFEENKQLARLFDNCLIAPSFGDKDPIEALRQIGVLARINRIPIQSPDKLFLTEQEKRFIEEFLDFPRSVLDRLSKNVHRNILIASLIAAQVKAGRATIVFACGVEHSKVLAAISTLKGATACAITHDMSLPSRVRSIDGFRSGRYGAIINYGILSTGFDAPNASAVIITRPTTSIVLYSQMLGRGMRGPKMGGQEECTLIDIVDNIEGFGEEEKIYRFFSEYWAHNISTGLSDKSSEKQSR